MTKGARHKIVLSIQKLRERQSLLKQYEKVCTSIWWHFFSIMTLTALVPSLYLPQLTQNKLKFLNMLIAKYYYKVFHFHLSFISGWPSANTFIVRKDLNKRQICCSFPVGIDSLQCQVTFLKVISAQAPRVTNKDQEEQNLCFLLYDSTAIF